MLPSTLNARLSGRTSQPAALELNSHQRPDRQPGVQLFRVGVSQADTSVGHGFHSKRRPHRFAVPAWNRVKTDRSAESHHVTHRDAWIVPHERGDGLRRHSEHAHGCRSLQSTGRNRPVSNERPGRVIDPHVLIGEINDCVTPSRCCSLNRRWKETTDATNRDERENELETNHAMNVRASALAP